MILLDTHILLWWIGGDAGRLSIAATKAIETAHSEGTILVSSISAWEIATLVARGRIGLLTDITSWLDQVGRLAGVEFVSLDTDILLKSTQLPGEFHKDPADRFIVATSQKLAVPLVTADRKILDYTHVKTIW